MFIILFALLASGIVSGLVWRYLLLRSILDMPNGRSAHSVPTPRGGGVSIVVVFLLLVLFFVQRGTLSSGLGRALIGGGLGVAIAGFLDDHFRVSIGLRLAIHFAAGGWALWQLNGMGPLDLGWATLNCGWLGQVVALVGLVWMINLYNFMDGIDGIAGVEAVCAGGAGALLLTWSGFEGLAGAALALMGASAGFLVWNWPPAKVFMGDVGSGFLGFAFGVMAIASAKERPSLLWPWLILLAVFIADSMLTLVRRLNEGTRWYEAHCSHAYQHAARRFGHRATTLAVLMINLFWLAPLALAAWAQPRLSLGVLVCAYSPLLMVAWRFNAGHASPAPSIVDGIRDWFGPIISDSNRRSEL